MKIELLPISKKYPYLSMDDSANYFIISGPRLSILLNNDSNMRPAVSLMQTLNTMPAKTYYRLVTEAYINKENEISILVSHLIAPNHQPYTIYNFARNVFDFYTWDEIQKIYEISLQQILISND
jgi:ABC-type anion transport system duplicated permease subunit